MARCRILSPARELEIFCRDRLPKGGCKSLTTALVKIMIHPHMWKVCAMCVCMCVCVRARTCVCLCASACLRLLTVCPPPKGERLQKQSPLEAR